MLVNSVGLNNYEQDVLYNNRFYKCTISVIKVHCICSVNTNIVIRVSWDNTNASKYCQSLKSILICKFG